MIVEFGFLNFKLLILLLYPIFIQIRELVIHAEKTSTLYFYFTSSIGYLLAGIFYLIILYRSKNPKKLSPSKKPKNLRTKTYQLYSYNQKIIKRRKIK